MVVKANLPICILTLLLLWLVGCSPAKSTSTSTAPVTLTVPVKPTFIFTNTDIPSPEATNTATVTPAPSVTSTITKFAAITQTPSPTTAVMGWEIESGKDRFVETAFWSKDGKLIYYATDSLTDHRVLDWFSYDITTRSTSMITSPYKYDKSMWKRLNLPEPGISPEVYGLISPSGRYILYTQTYGNPPLDPDPNARVEIWLADTQSWRKTRLFKNLCCSLSEAAWLPDESKVIFSAGYEGPVDLIFVDVQDGSWSRGSVAVEDYWALSPDGAKLAVYGMTGDFQGVRGLLFTSTFDSNPNDVVILDDEGWWPFRWSQDSRYLYYWAKPIDSFGSWLRVYDTDDGSIHNLVDRTSIENALGHSPAGQFAVSPDGNKLVFWNRSLLLVELMKW
jgi:Tol biopolymer transport system component